MICKGIYEVLTPSVRLSRFATHVETGRPRKSAAIIHGDAARRCKPVLIFAISLCRGGGEPRAEVLSQEAFQLGERADSRIAAGLHPVILAGQLHQLDRLAALPERLGH